MSNDVSSKWYLLYCKSKEEAKASLHLANQGIESFYPTIHIEKCVRGKKKLVVETLFPSYLFVKIDPLRANFNAIRSTRGVNDFVKFGGNYASVSADLVEYLSTSVEQHQHAQRVLCQLPKSGDKVRVESGPFAGLEAIYQSDDGLERSVLLIKLINQWQKISLPNTQCTVAA
ncbi:transcription/translation regulatory transformer protein RfaH [Motilimonas cestriensis]|uniref:Transcription antitermination protein RfaH n=1 Tax=Motilimonas cestriensis TaxID=2742685 RepID=A0ABS8W8G2_9GAMM|nr:transcription/translation regulatory transformer protein RfaH [Motilimonas cestriensis]MCE2594051.1 transcription/translation regulatory transformer protein RfaH [Motilimonas cestriensis]